jgi:Lysozyme like domain
MSVKGINGPGLAAVTVGGILIYGGIKGYSILKAFQNIIQGNPANQGQQVALLTNAADISGGINSSVPIAGMYTHAGLMKLWTSEGGPSATANNAACHGMQESGGNPKITSSNPDGGTNVGLWQLDTRGVGAGHSISALQDPRTNARITIQATNGGRNWSAWATPGC